MSIPPASAPDSVRERLLQAALDSFLADDYHKVSTRLIADKADANVAMIRYCFGNKEGLYEEMIRETLQTLQTLLAVLDGAMLHTADGFKAFFKLYYDTMGQQPAFPRLILKVLALNQGPGRRFIQQLLERGRTRGARKVAELKATGQLAPALDPDMVRIAFVSLAMMLRMLAAMGVFHEDRPHGFSNNRLSAHLRTDHPQCVRAMVLMHNSAEMATPWFQTLAHGVRTGQVPFEISHGENLYGYMSHHPEFDALFARAMDSVEALTGSHFATDFDWSRFDRVIDVGGSRGSKAQAILHHHPHMQALVFDRPTVVAAAQADWQVQAPPQMAQRLRFLAVAVMELVVPEHRADYASAAFDMQMFMGTQGRERTLSEWRTLVASADLALQEVVGLQSLGSILLLRSATVSH